jgi:hypothetical protein
LRLFSGISLIIGFESKYIAGILVGLSSAFCASLFNVLNGKYVKTVSTYDITKYEMLGGFMLMFVVLLVSGKVDNQLMNVIAARLDLFTDFRINLHNGCFFSLCLADEIFVPFYGQYEFEYGTHLCHFNRIDFRLV